MNRYVKYSLFGLGGIVGLLAGAAGFLAATFDPNDYKPLIVKLVQEKKQRTLALDGDIRLTFFPRIGADLGRLSLSERDSAEVFASVEGARVSLELLPLLKKELVVNQVRLDGVKARLVRYPDGHTNIDDLLRQEEDSTQFKFAIDRVEVTRSSLTLDDRQGGRRVAVSDLAFSSGRIASGQPTEVDTAFRLQSDHPRLDAKVSLASGLLFDLEAKRYRLDGLKAGLEGDVGGRLTAKAEVPLLDISPDAVRGDKVAVNIALNRGGNETTLVTTLSGFEGGGPALKVAEARVEAEGRQGATGFKASLVSPVSGNLEAKRFELPKLALNLTATGADLPGGKVTGALTGRGTADLEKGAVHLDLAGQADGNPVRLMAGTESLAPLRLVFDAELERLDLDRYAGTKKEGGPEKPLDLSALDGLDASGSLRVGSLRADKLKVSALRAEVRLGDGHLRVAPLSAQLYGGSLNGAFSATTRGPLRVTVEQRMTGIDVGPLLRDLTGKDTLEGHGSVSVDVNASGATVSAMKKTLDGSASLNLRDGAIKGINVAQALRNAQAKLGALKGQQTVTASAAEKTDFAELSASFAIRDGIAHNEDLALKSPLLRVGGNGDVDLPASSVDYLVKASVVGTLEGQGGKELAALKGVTVPIRVSGPFDGLRYTLDFNALAGEAVKQKVEEKKAEVREKAREELKKGLQDLFKR